MYFLLDFDGNRRILKLAPWHARHSSIVSCVQEKSVTSDNMRGSGGRISGMLLVIAIFQMLCATFS